LDMSIAESQDLYIYDFTCLFKHVFTLLATKCFKKKTSIVNIR
jgi:hypothetical protein